MRDHWLREMTFHGGFPIPWRLHGRDVLDRYAVPGPVLYSTLHLPLVDVPLRVSMELPYPTPVPIADPGRIVDGNGYVVPGMAKRIPALPASGHALARMRTVLQNGTSVVCLADSQFGGELFTNPMRLTGRLHVPVVFVWAELASDDVVEAHFELAPHPYCETDEAIASNLSRLRQINDRILESLGVTSAAAALSLESRNSQTLKSAPERL